MPGRRASRASSQSASATGASIGGIRLRPHCSHAAIAMRRQCSARVPRCDAPCERAATTGATDAQPSSTALRTA
jgi:hypothetical protein